VGFGEPPKPTRGPRVVVRLKGHWARVVKSPLPCSDELWGIEA